MCTGVQRLCERNKNKFFFFKCGIYPCLLLHVHLKFISWKMGFNGKDKGSRLDLRQILRIISIFGSVAIP